MFNNQQYDKATGRKRGEYQEFLGKINKSSD